MVCLGLPEDYGQMRNKWLVDAADAYIVNTCTVTQISDKKSRQIISQAHRRNPDAMIAAVGCYA